MNQDLHGKAALVIGAARGIGAATAEALAEPGAAIVVTDVLDGDGEGMAARLRTAGLNARHERLDVIDEAYSGRIVDAAVADVGRLDALVNNAGIGTPPGLHRHPDDRRGRGHAGRGLDPGPGADGSRSASPRRSDRSSPSSRAPRRRT